jgi:putative membrane protein
MIGVTVYLVRHDPALLERRIAAGPAAGREPAQKWNQAINVIGVFGWMIVPGQRVVDTGPYAIVRHPMYAGGFLLFVGAALTLSSYWALLFTLGLTAFCRPMPGNLFSVYPSNGWFGSTTLLKEPSMMLTRIALFTALTIIASAPLAQSADKPTDPQIAHIAYTAGEIDLEAAELAKKKSKNKAVLAFADDMIRDHTAVNEQALALVKKLKVTPEDNATSKALSQQAEEARKKLNSLAGEAFDKAYAENEVAYHQIVNNALRDSLIPSAQNSELKALLTTGLKIFEGHQQHAEHLAQEIK